MSPREADRWVTVAILGKPRGNRGELTALGYYTPAWYQDLKEVSLCVPGGAGTIPGSVESVWQHGEKLIFKFRGVDSITEAERLRGAEVRIPHSRRPEAEPGAYYHSDLIGCDVVERKSGELLGRVSGWRETGGAPLLEVGDLLIPFAASICVQINPAARQIVVELPEGLKDLNRS